jgi:hypothetical protein
VCCPCPLLLQIVPNVRERLLELFYGIYRKDSSEVRGTRVSVWGGGKA